MEGRAATATAFFPPIHVACDVVQVGPASNEEEKLRSRANHMAPSAESTVWISLVGKGVVLSKLQNNLIHDVMLS